MSEASSRNASAKAAAGRRGRDTTIDQGLAALPKYRQICEIVKEAIAKGEYRPGQRLPTEAQYCQQFETSRLTVNRALRELQLGGWIQRRAGSGSYVSSSQTSGYAFGLLIPELGTTEIFEPICRGMANVRLSEHHELLWGRSPSDGGSKEAQARETCRQWIAQKVSGVFFAPLELTGRKDAVNREVVDLFDAAGIPVVLIDRDLLSYPARSKYDLVGIDNRRAGYVLTKHLLDAGCQRPIFIDRHNSAPTCVARSYGFRDALVDAGVGFSNLQIIHDADPVDVDQVKRMVSDVGADAVVCSNDFTAAQLMRSLEVIGLDVPTDIKVAGFDDVKYASLLPVALTTIHQPCAAMGAAAIRAMMERLHDPGSPPRDVLLDFRLVIRESTGGSTRKRPL